MRRLFSLGPVNVPHEVRNEAHEIQHWHRSEEFSNTIDQVSERVRTVLRASNDYAVLLLNGSGTAGVEMLVSSLSGPVLVCSNGAFGEKWQSMCSKYCPTVCFRQAWGKPLVASEIVESALSHACKAVVFVHHETSCGVINDMVDISRRCAEYGLFSFADCVSSVGVEDIDITASKVTGMTFTSNKGTCSFPGLSCIVIDRAYATSVSAERIPTYLNLRVYFDAYEKRQTPFTAPVQLINCFYKALSCMTDYQKRSKENMRVLRQGMELRGFDEVYKFPPGSQCSSVSLCVPPCGLNITDFQRYLNDSGYVINTFTKGVWEGRAIHLSTYGEIQDTDVAGLLQTVDAYALAKSVKLRPRAGFPLIVLAAGIGSRLGASLPKCMVDVGGGTILERMIATAKDCQVSSVTIVVGHRRDVLVPFAEKLCSTVDIAFHAVVNEMYSVTNTAKSLLTALDAFPSLFAEGFILADGDLVCDPVVFHNVAVFPETCTAVTRPSQTLHECTDLEAVRVVLRNNSLRCARIGKDVGAGYGESVGLNKICFPLELVRSSLAEVDATRYYEDAFDSILAQHPECCMTAIDVTGYVCTEVDTQQDLAAVCEALSAS